MSKDQGARRYLDIPGEKTFVYTFKFNMDLPAPVPPPKTMYIPLDPERYIKPKLTLFHVKRKANLLSDINLSIPVDEVNMRPELYNPGPDAKFELTEKDRELLEEKPTVKKEESKTQATNGKAQTAGQKDKDAAAKAQPSTKAKPDAAQTKKPEPAQAPKKKEEQKKLSIDEYVKKTFEVSSTYTTGIKHPTKEGLQCQEVFEILPDFSNIITELYTVKAEVSAETIKSKENIIKFETDLDKKPIVGLYLSAPLGEGATQGMEEENEEAKEKTESLLKRVENFEHFGNYNYSNPKPHGTIKRDLLLNVNKASGKALIYQPHSLILKKKKVLFMTKTVYKDEDMEEEGKKPKEKKRTIKILKRNLDKDELLLKKKKFKELQLENTGVYKKNNKDLEGYKDPEEDELDIIRKRFAVEEEEEENQGEEDENAEEEKEAGYADEDKGSNDDRGSQREEERNEPMEEEEQYNEEEKEQKPAKAGSDDDDAQELADFFGGSDEDDDD